MTKPAHFSIDDIHAAKRRAVASALLDEAKCLIVRAREALNVPDDGGDSLHSRLFHAQQATSDARSAIERASCDE